MEEIIASISSIIFPLFMVAFVAFLLPIIQGKSLKELKENFSTNESFPADGFRLVGFICGKTRWNGMVGIAENAQGIYLQIPLKTVLFIPFAEIKSVTIKDSLFGIKIFTIICKKTEIQPIILHTNKPAFAKIPHLMKLIKDYKFNEQNLLEKVDLTNKIDLTNTIDIIKNSQEIKKMSTKAGDAVRIIIIIFALVFGAIAILAWAAENYS